MTVHGAPRRLGAPGQNPAYRSSGYFSNASLLVMLAQASTHVPREAAALIAGTTVGVGLRQHDFATREGAGRPGERLRSPIDGGGGDGRGGVA
jgi:hypothetical protein